MKHLLSRSSQCVLIIGLLLCLIWLVGCQSQEAAQAPTPTPMPTPVVPRKPVYEVARGNVVETLQITGRVIPVVEQALAFQVDGRVARVFVAEGDTVEAGAVLAEQEQVDDLTRRQQEGELSVRRAQIQQEIATLELQAFRLTADEIEPDYEQQEAILEHRVELAGITLEEAELALEDLESVVNAARLTAPIDGLVLSFNVREGRNAVAYETVAVIADMTALEISADINTSDMTLLQEGMPVTFTPASGPGDSYSGVIRRLPYPYGGGSLDVDDSDDSVRFALDKPPQEVGLEPGARLRGTITVGESIDTLWLPPQAIRTFEGRHFVIVQNGDVQQRVDVRLGLQSDERVEILEGPTEGQQVIGP